MFTNLSQLKAQHFNCPICDFSNTAFNASMNTTLNCRGCSARIPVPPPIISDFQKNAISNLPITQTTSFWKRPRKHSYTAYAVILAIILITPVLMTIIFSIALNEPRKLFGFVLLAAVTISLVYSRQKHKRVSSIFTRIRTFPKRVFKQSNTFPHIKSESYIKQMNGYEFENWFAKVLKWNGYKTEVTPKSGDGGVDIVMYESTGKRLIQCKRMKKKAGVKALRELRGVMAYQRVASGGFVCTGGFTKKAIEFCKTENITLWDMTGIMRLQKRKK